jgi:hypothetical protein
MGLAKRHGASGQTIDTWKKRFGALATNDVRRLKSSSSLRLLFSRTVA